MRKTKTKKPPRLERLNAKKNINYRLPIIPTIPSPTPSPPHQESSLRVMGIDGEFDRIFQSLGLSGPEDFAIPAQDWEARKARSLLSLSLPDPDPVSLVVDYPSSSGEHDVVDRLRNGERSVLFTDSGSFSTSHDYDSDGAGAGAGATAAAAERTLFPYGWLKPTFSSWQKGALLGKGSFGTVYECYTE